MDDRLILLLIFKLEKMGTAYLPKLLHETGYLFFAYTLPTSNLMFILDVNPKEDRRRLENRGGKVEMFESLEELREMRARIVGLARKYGWTIIDADKPILEIHKEIKGFLTSKWVLTYPVK